MDFDWDDGNRDKAQKHGLTIGEIEGFFRLRPCVAPDPEHSTAEQRHIAVGLTPNGRPIFVAFCWRDGKVRPISARYMHRKEAERHGYTTPNRPRHDH